MATIQGVKLRQQIPGSAPAQLTDEISTFLSSLESTSPFLVEDRVLEGELRQIAALIRNEHWTLYDGDTHA